MDRRIQMLIEKHAVRMLAEAYREEIERAIDNAKRTDWDKKFRSGWYRAEAVRRKKERMAWPRRWKRKGRQQWLDRGSTR